MSIVCTNLQDTNQQNSLAYHTYTKAYHHQATCTMNIGQAMTETYNTLMSLFIPAEPCKLTAIIQAASIHVIITTTL